VQVTAGNPDTVLSQTSLIQEVGNLHNAQAAQFLVAAQTVQRATDQVQRTEAGIQSLTSATAAKQAHLKSLIQHEKDLLSSMSGAQITSVIQQSGTNVITQAGQVPAPYTNPTTAAQRAVNYVFNHIGDNYVWGATGPSTFDCSGLMMAAYADAGITIPRDTFSQVAALPAVSYSNLQPGDLVFFEADNHVGMYVGVYNGIKMMIDAPATGQTVTFHPLSESWYASNFVSAAHVPGA
jgi:cell wall-associated NlpC family hydrolase